MPPWRITSWSGWTWTYNCKASQRLYWHGTTAQWNQSRCGTRYSPQSSQPFSTLRGRPLCFSHITFLSVRSLLNQKKKKKKNPRRRPHAQHRYTSRRAAGTGSGMIRPPIFDLTVLFPSRRGKQPKEKRTWDTVDAGDCDATCQTWQLARVCVNIIVISSGGV